jgi:hypothetical protein
LASASAKPCSAAFAYHAAAREKSCATPRPLSYISAKIELDAPGALLGGAPIQANASA